MSLKGLTMSWNSNSFNFFKRQTKKNVHFAQNNISHAQFAQNSFPYVHFAQNSIFHEIEFFSCSLHKIKERTRPASSITLKILESKKKKKKKKKKSFINFCCNYCWKEWISIVGFLVCKINVLILSAFFELFFSKNSLLSPGKKVNVCYKIEIRENQYYYYHFCQDFETL